MGVFNYKQFIPFDQHGVAVAGQSRQEGAKAFINMLSRTEELDKLAQRTYMISPQLAQYFAQYMSPAEAALLTGPDASRRYSPLANLVKMHGSTWFVNELRLALGPTRVARRKEMQDLLLSYAADDTALRYAVAIPEEMLKAMVHSILDQSRYHFRDPRTGLWEKLPATLAEGNRLKANNQDFEADLLSKEVASEYERLASGDISVANMNKFEMIQNYVAKKGGESVRQILDGDDIPLWIMTGRLMYLDGIDQFNMWNYDMAHFYLQDLIPVPEQTPNKYAYPQYGIPVYVGWPGPLRLDRRYGDENPNYQPPRVPVDSPQHEAWLRTREGQDWKDDWRRSAEYLGYELDDEGNPDRVYTVFGGFGYNDIKIINDFEPIGDRAARILKQVRAVDPDDPLEVGFYHRVKVDGPDMFVRDKAGHRAQRKFFDVLDDRPGASAEANPIVAMYHGMWAAAMYGASFLVDEGGFAEDPEHVKKHSRFMKLIGFRGANRAEMTPSGTRDDMVPERDPETGVPVRYGKRPDWMHPLSTLNGLAWLKTEHPSLTVSALRSMIARTTQKGIKRTAPSPGIDAWNANHIHMDTPRDLPPITL